MRILFFEADTDQARELQSQILAYRGIRWDLVHCENLADASAWLEREHFDATLLSLPSYRRIGEDYEAFIKHSFRTPVVAILPPEMVASGGRLVRLGATDCLTSRDIDGNYLMRRLRMAAAHHHRNDIAIRQIANHWQTPLSKEATSGDSNGAKSSCVAIQSSETVDATDASRWESDRKLSVAVVEKMGLVPPGPVDRLDRTNETLRLLPTSIDRLATLIEEEPAGIDAILASQSLLDDRGFETIQTLRDQLGSIPIVILMADHSDTMAVTCIEHGVEDCLELSRTSWQEIERAIRLAWARTARRHATMEDSLRDIPKTSERRTDERPSRDRRRVGP